MSRGLNLIGQMIVFKMVILFGLCFNEYFVCNGFYAFIYWNTFVVVPKDWPINAWYKW
jgi:hypothetical protein